MLGVLVLLDLILHLHVVGVDDGPGGTPAPPGERGREPPFFFFFLDLHPRWEKGFPFGPWPPWRRRGESVTPTMRLYLPCVGARLRGITAW